MKHGEDSLQIAVANYLRLQYPRLLWWHTPNGIPTGGTAAERGRRINRFKQMGLRPGVSDILMFWEDKKAAIELKYGDNGMSDYQKDFRNRWEECGGLFAVCRNLYEVQDALEKWAVPKALICRPAYAEGSVSPQYVRPSKAGKRGDV